MYKYIVDGIRFDTRSFSSYKEYKEFMSTLPKYSYAECRLYIPYWRALILYNLSQYREGKTRFVDYERELNERFDWGRTSYVAYCGDFSPEEKEFFGDYPEDRAYLCVEKETYPGRYWLMRI